VQFALSALIAFLFMTLTVALAVILARSGTCSGPVCIATKADALFSGFSYALWTITALLLGISLSKPKDRRELDVGDEKIDALRRKSAY
jgi:cytochrome bd-type quinol oxidase subunit 1